MSLRKTAARSPWRQVILFGPPGLMLLFILVVGMAVEGAQQFAELAQAFLHGHLYFLHSIGGYGYDPVLYRGHVYWDEGPFPAIPLLPFVALFNLFHQIFYVGYVKWLLVLGTLFFIYKIARRLRYTAEDSWLLTFAFALGSVYVGVASVSSGWLFAQVVNTFLLCWGLSEFYHRRRWWLIGLTVGAVFLTRATAAPVVLFYALEIWFELPRPERTKPYLQLFIPLALAVGLQGLYNFARFHSPFNGGFRYQLLIGPQIESRSLGVFSWRHISGNLYALLLSPPQSQPLVPGSWNLRFPYIAYNTNGTSIFLTSPYLIYLFTCRLRSFGARVWRLLLAAAISCLAVLCFYGIGRAQFGYRYGLDFFPELFLVFMIMYRQRHDRLSRGMQVLLLGGMLFNFYLVLTYIFA